MLHIFISYRCNLLSGKAREQAEMMFLDPQQDEIQECSSEDTGGRDEE